MVYQPPGGTGSRPSIELVGKLVQLPGDRVLTLGVQERLDRSGVQLGSVEAEPGRYRVGTLEQIVRDGYGDLHIDEYNP